MSRTSSARIGRPPVADQDAILRAALDIGFSRLTMAAVGARLGISHSTLYRYFRNRDDLAVAAVGRAVEAVDWPLPQEDWRDFLERTAWAHWRLHEANPGLAREITSLRLTCPALVRRDNQTGVHLLNYGFSPADAVLVIDMLAELVTQEFLVDDAEAGEDLVDGFQRRRRELVAPLLSDYDPRLRAVVEDAVGGSVSAWFERKLALFLDGVAMRHRTF
jgi:AcrR family transcriptional regulator